MKAKHGLLLFLMLFTILGCSNLSINNIVRQSCLPVESNKSLIQLEDGLILTGEDTYILNGNTELQTHLPMTKNNDYYVDVSNFLVTQDKKRASYIATYYQYLNGSLSYVDQSLIVLQNGRNEIEATAWQPDVEKLIDWFDNDRLLVSPLNHSDGTIILFDPLTDEKQVIQPTFPHIYNLDPIPWYKSANPLPIYNLSMSHVFYIRNSLDSMEFVLNNRITGKTVWSEVVQNPTNKPQWFSSGNKVLIAIPKNAPSEFEFYSIDRDGKETTLSSFASVYRFTNINGFSLSPNDVSIGFWLDGRNNRDEYNPRFAIFDLQTKQTIDYCIGYGGGPIIWSPKGNQVALKVVDRNNVNEWFTVVIDIKKNVAVKIADQEYPVGWILSK